MKFKHALCVRRAVIVGVATVALGAVASPALAQARGDVGPTVHGSTPRSGRLAGVERRGERFRGRHQLRLDEARNLLGERPRAH
jgi:hypothetical protein